MTQALRRSSLLDCQRCGLRESRKRVVPGEGPVPCEICLIGEAPGFVEDTLGRPFVGSAGEILDEAIEYAGVNRDELYITNVVKCRPPGNRTPESGEITTCSGSWLWDELREVQPERIITLGRVPTSLFFAFGGMADVEGKCLETYVSCLIRNVLIFPVYHPAAALYNPRLRGKFFSAISGALP